MDQSSAPWRVFDAPAADGNSRELLPGTGGGPQADAGSAAGILANQQLAIAGVIGAVAIGVLAIALAVAGSGGATIQAPDAGAGGTIASSEPRDGGAELVVDVAGAVANPGLYRLPVGSRVGDAITAAGGYGPRVDVGRVATALNLAALLSDGAQVRVPSRDDPEAGGGAGGGGGSGSGGGSGGQVVNLNSATQSELESLPGIGPVTAGKIIESRAGSRFGNVDELRERGLVGEKTFESIKALITVG